MLRIMLQKLMHKKWLVICLLIGNILLVAITASFPMYRDASLQKMLITEFDNYRVDKSIYPAKIILGHTLDSKKQVNDFWNMEEKSNNICNTLGLTMKEQVKQYTIPDAKVTPKMIRDEKKNDKIMSVLSMSDFENHTKILSGSKFSSKKTKDGYIEAVVSQASFNTLNLLIGDEFVCPSVLDKDGKEVKIRIVGIFTISDENDTYWNTSPSALRNHCFISQEVFKSEFLNDKQYNNKVIGKWMVNFDYTKVHPEQVNSLITKTKSMVTVKGGKYKSFESPIYMDILNSYKSGINRVQSTLLILIVPVFVLLCAFIFMISNQMLSLESNEIALFKSRGASKIQILCLYLLQSVCLALASLVVALPLASFLCKALGSANAFLEFVQRTSLTIHYSRSVLLYSMAAVGVSVLITILPVLKNSSISIVNLKQKKARNQKKLWQKLYIDVIILVFSIYCYYNFSQQKTDILYRVVTGRSMDPLLFFSSSLFILGAGLFALRLQPILVKVIYRIGKKRWKPANYASFLNIIRNGSKQYFIMVFMILTISLGIFNATIARTIVLNAEKNAEYSTGTELVFEEQWRNNYDAVLKGFASEFLWYEPEYNRYKQLNQVESIAQVYRNPKVNVDSSGDMLTELMAFNTKDFGNTAYLPSGLNNHLFNEYLNVLSTRPNAVLLSSNYMTKKGLKIGDKIILSNAYDDVSYNVQDDMIVEAVVYGFVDYWPGYKATSVNVYEDGNCETVDNYLVIANQNYIEQRWKKEPYQVWMKLKDKDTSFFYDYVSDNDINLNKLIDQSQTIINISREPLFQGTNGILTMSFIVILILCCIGYLIYWILSIRSRELLFGVFRAMGMSKGEIIHMLINEQLFTGGLAIVLGAGIGILASRLFIPLIQIAYSGENQALPLELMTQTGDMVRLFVIVTLVFIACMCILAWLVYKLKIAQALKLGED